MGKGGQKKEKKADEGVEQMDRNEVMGRDERKHQIGGVQFCFVFL